jgi:LacI family transcriptional regulator
MTGSRQGRRGATIYSVAQQAGVSIATVSRVLQGSDATTEATRAKVLQAAEELNYLPLRAARSLAVRRHEAHGLVMPELDGFYYSELLAGYESAAARLGQSVIVLITESRDDPARAVRDLAGRVDGLVIGFNTVPGETAKALGETMPTVLLARDAVPGCDAVATENTESARSLTAHLIGHGRRNLLFVGDPDGSPDFRDRYRGFQLAHRDSGVRLRRAPSRVPVVEQAGFDFADRLVRRRGAVDALVCGDDELALSIIHRLQRRGVRVPDDIAVVGWDDVMASRYVSPGLTTVRQPVRQLGEFAASRLQERITGSPVNPEPHVLPTRAVFRSSCGCPEPALTSDEPAAQR